MVSQPQQQIVHGPPPPPLWLETLVVHIVPSRSSLRLGAAGATRARDSSMDPSTV